MGRRIRYCVIYEKGPSSWGASVPDLPGCIAVGATRQEAETLIREAIEAIWRLYGNMELRFLTAA
jgi:predicted RNase H-like HicB family nuclease